jgi:hypothetical protein
MRPGHRQALADAVKASRKKKSEERAVIRISMRAPFVSGCIAATETSATRSSPRRKPRSDQPSKARGCLVASG